MKLKKIITAGAIVAIFATSAIADLKSFYENEKWGFKNENNKVVIPPKYDAAEDFAENGLGKVELNGKMGYINAKGEVAIPLEYSYISWFGDDGLAEVKLNGQRGSINAKGEVVIPFK